MIVGVGTDLVEVARIKLSLECNGDRLAQRILTPQELGHFLDHGQKAHFLAKRFAAKEASSKALQTGIGRISWQDINVSSTKTGAPRLEFSGKARERLFALGAREAYLSLSDERHYALAFVVLSA